MKTPNARAQRPEREQRERPVRCSAQSWALSASAHGSLPRLSVLRRSPFLFSLNNRVSSQQQRLGDRQAKRLGGLEVITSSNLVGCSTGRSLGFAPLKILST
jgi:hypothetical protein